MTRVITEAEAAEALAAEWPVDDPPSVGTEDARRLANWCEVMAAPPHSKSKATYFESTAIALRNLVSERDALAGRVAELEAALWGCIAAIERTHHCTEEDRLAAADKARAALSATTPESKP